MENKSSGTLDSTIAYYNDNAKDYIRATINADMSKLYAAFEHYLFPGCFILDLGSGSGRDSKYFINQGYHVTAIDPSEEMCASTQKVAGIVPLQIKAEELNIREKYDGVWACASLLHLETAKLQVALLNIYRALKPGGVFYTSFKYGVEEREVGGRVFHNYTEATANNLIHETGLFEVAEIFITGDTLPEREDERWVNIIAKKRK